MYHKQNSGFDICFLQPIFLLGSPLIGSFQGSSVRGSSSGFPMIGSFLGSSVRGSSLGFPMIGSSLGSSVI